MRDDSDQLIDALKRNKISYRRRYGFNYNFVAVEIFRHTTGGSDMQRRAKPLPNQGFDDDLHVECSEAFRNSNPVGTCFLIWAKLKNNPFKTCLYTHYRWKYYVVDKSLAERLIEEGEVGLFGDNKKPAL